MLNSNKKEGQVGISINPDRGSVGILINQSVCRSKNIPTAPPFSYGNTRNLLHLP